MTETSIYHLADIDLRFVPRPWAFADEKRGEIDAYFQKLQQSKPLWNGRVLLMFEHHIDRQVLRGRYLETDYASFLAWRDWGFPDSNIRNCFAPAALQGSDGGYVLGVMADHTANAGKVYFPCGTPDPDDLVGDRVDLERSARRELLEETGIDPDELQIDAGWRAILSGPRIALLKPMQARLTAEALCARIRQHIATETEPELADACVVAGLADLDARIPEFVRAYITQALAD